MAMDQADQHSLAADDSARRQTSLPSRRLFARTLAGIALGMRQFANEFGLPLDRVFSDGFEAFKGHDPEVVINAWLSEDSFADRRLQRLLDDISDHQFAIACAVAELPSAVACEAREPVFRVRQAWHTIRGAGPVHDCGGMKVMLLALYDRARRDKRVTADMSGADTDADCKPVPA